MWLNLLGHRFGLPPETPKPLFVLLCGVIWQGALYPIMCAFTVGVLAFLMKLARHFGASYWAGFAAFLLFIAANKTVLPEFIMPAYYPMLYFFLLLGSVYYFVKKQALAASLFLCGAGLMRPEAWVIPIVFIGVTMFKRERGFLWWPCLAFIAPLLWVLFDIRIAGSPTYSADVTQDYLASLGVVSVSFTGYWPAILQNVAGSFYWPVHVFGLAGLCYLAIRRRNAGHLLMAAFVALPFFAFWFLSFAKPIIIHVRFLSFPMLVCCLYAMLFLTDIFRNRWLLGISVAALFCIGFRPELIKDTREMIAADKIILEGRERSLAVIKKMEKEPEILLCGRSVAFFSYHLGERASKRIIMFREIVANDAPLRCIRKGIAVYLQGDCGISDDGFLSLAIPRRYKIGSFGYFPVYQTEANACIVYVLQRLSDHPLPPSCSENRDNR